MSKVALVQVPYNTQRFMPIVYPPLFQQTYADIEVTTVFSGNEDKGIEYLQEHFPQVKIINPGYNIGFAKGHNDMFASIDADFFQLINPDLVITPNFVEEMLKPFADPKVGAVSGKILRYDFEKNQPTNQIDTTGVVIARSGRGRDRGQHEIDQGQYDDQTDLIAASGAAVMYRKAALEDVKYHRPDGRIEYFDEDMHSYWEDVDLAWRMVNSGWKIKYNPQAVAFHGRAAGSSSGGYKKVFSFISHHKKISPWIRQLNYKNHIFLFLKNSPRWYWQFFVRELAYQIYVLIFETSTLKILPTLFKQLPRMWAKRKYIQQHRKIAVAEIERLLT